MKIQQFLQHHGIGANPFADEDAQTDLVFKGSCIANTYHPTWDKIYGDPSEPATSVVFGEKGSGKTALRLQISHHLTTYNADHPDSQAFVVFYDDFNPYLDRFRERFRGRRRRPERALQRWHLWDHMDAVLSLAVTQLVDRILQVKQARHPAARDEAIPIGQLDAAQVRDVMLLAACYDQSTAEGPRQRWNLLRKKLGFSTWKSRWDIALGGVATPAILGLFVWLWYREWLPGIWKYLLVLLLAGAWAPRAWRWTKWCWKSWRIARCTRVLNHSHHVLRRILLCFSGEKIVGQPLPASARTDDRYELLIKLQGILRALRFEGLFVLIDRVDEPYIINGSADLMRALVWPMLDNKFLKHPGMGLKLLLPDELERLVDREDRDFHQRARLDKQNLVRSLRWTGQSLYDVANARLTACAADGGSPTLAQLFDESIDERRLIDTFGMLRVPRHLFKFLYRLITDHCNAHSDDSPVWRISSERFEAVLAVFQRDQEAFDRGEGAG